MMTDILLLYCYIYILLNHFTQPKHLRFRLQCSLQGEPATRPTSTRLVTCAGIREREMFAPCISRTVFIVEYVTQ